MPGKKLTGVRRIKRRTDETEGARQWNTLRDVVLQNESSRVSPVGTPASSTPFVHFRIEAINENGSWKGYVGNGFLGTTQDGGGANLAQELWNQLDVTHEATSIKLDMTDLPWDDGIDTLMQNSKGKALSASTTYYVYLKLSCNDNQVKANNSTDISTNGNVILETVDTAVTSFETAVKLTSTTASQDGSEVLYRWYLLGVVKTGTANTATPMYGQLSYDAIYLPPVYRGRLLVTGLNINSNGEIYNDGVTAIFDSSSAINVDANTGDVTFTDGP